MPGSIHHMLVSTAAGLVLLGSTAALAEQKDTMIGEPAVQRTDARHADVKHSGLTGGFYADKNKGDGWYYDFYEGPSAGREDAQSAGGQGDTLQDIAGGVDRECRAALEKLCAGVQPGGGRVRKCFEANEGKLTPSCREQVYERKSEATAILAMASSKEGEPTSKLEPTPVATVGNYPVLFAERVSVAHATPIKVARPDGDYPGASRQDMEASQILDSGDTAQPKNMPQPR